MIEGEFEFTDDDFKRIAKIVNSETGIIVNDSKRSLVYSRLAKRIRTLKLGSFKEYVLLVEANQNNELMQCINSITTNLTGFFRENHHFEHLREALDGIFQQKKKLRIWSAGCSSGQEPYSIALTILSKVGLGNIKNYDIKILATDIDTDILTKASNGIYSEEEVKNVPADMLRKFFEEFKNEDGDTKYKIDDSVKKLITFNRLNLQESWPMKGPFDVVFCRNVVIYFDKPTQGRLFNKYAELMEDSAWLYIGHSESLNNVSDRFKLIGKTIYQKIK